MRAKEICEEYAEKLFFNGAKGLLLMGDVTIAKEEVALCDAHYVSKTITFHAKYVSDDLTWYV